jgi:hypothetical protein
MTIEALADVACRSLDSLDASVQGPAASQAMGELIGSVDRRLARAGQRVTVERLTRLLARDAREIVRLRFDEDLKQIRASCARHFCACKPTPRARSAGRRRRPAEPSARGDR